MTFGNMMSDQYAPAPWIDRLIAVFVDLVVLWLLEQVLPITTCYYRLLPEDVVSGTLEFLSNAEVYLLAPVYFVMLRRFWGGQTIGKRILGLRTVPASGHELKFWQAFMDCLGYIVWPIDVLVGMLFSRSGDQRMTQIFAGTRTIKESN